MSISIRIKHGFMRDYISDDEGKVVVYMTSCGVVHSTWERCHEAVELLHNLNIQVEVRDLNLDTSLIDELIDRLQLQQIVSILNTFVGYTKECLEVKTEVSSVTLASESQYRLAVKFGRNGIRMNQKDDKEFVYNNLPLIYVNGYYFGNEASLFEWNEKGHLSNALQKFYGRKNCQECGGVGYRLCSECRGSKRSKRCFGELILRCANCDQNGIVLCQNCLHYTQ
uniref:Glutaredoxin domain-containing protein n=1 Tax=Syphacia muris TaxID=451379 RepID=A0A0N5AMV9_9BILA